MKLNGRNTMQAILRYTALGMIFVLIWIVLVQNWVIRYSPKSSSFSRTLANRVEMKEAREIQHDGNRYLALIVDTTWFPVFPSGPAVYIYNSSGGLVDWTLVDGDDPDYGTRWPHFYTGKVVPNANLATWASGSSNER